MKNLNKNVLKQLAKTLHEPVKNLLILRAIAQVTREKVDQIYADVIKENTQIYDQFFGKLITTREELSYAHDDDFKKIFEIVDQRIRSLPLGAGLGKDLCPALIAESTVSAQEKLLIELAEKYTKISHDEITYNLKNYRDYMVVLVQIGLNF